MRLACLILVLLSPLFAQSHTDGDVQAFVPHLTPLKRIAGVLPDAARSQGLQGTVRMLVTIDSQGLVTNVEPLTGPEILRQPAIDAVRKTCKHDRPVGEIWQQPLRYRAIVIDQIALRVLLGRPIDLVQIRERDVLLNGAFGRRRWWIV